MSDDRPREAATTADRASSGWDADAIRAGAVTCLAIAIPATLLGAAVDGARTVSFFLAVLGFVIGSGSAAWAQRRGTPLSHGLVTAIGTYVAAQAVFVVVRLITGGVVNWFAVLFTLSIVSFAGLVGGFLGQRLRSRGLVPSAQR
ncbi:hypothetical protein [Ilumatobacter sp.]|uniref:hypothetical protein n=1 Tax=Ilumatobacter sp. TaxID=1967498 RepID=UPI003B522876